LLYAEQWAALAARIRSLREAGELYANFQSSNSSDEFGGGNFLRAQCADVVSELERFQQEFGPSLPPGALTQLDRFFKTSAAQAARDAATKQRGARAALIALSALESELTFTLSDRQEYLRARSERALMHLRRTLAVDKEQSAKWSSAFRETRGEEACEQLGALHLLWHGIFAFKVDATGACTDLVFNEPVGDAVAERGIEWLVLTEWKTANAENADKRFSEARTQADLYNEGALAGTELTGYRYLIAVSLKELPAKSLPHDETTDGGVIYRYINIPIAPDTPSVRARSKSSRK